MDELPAGLTAVLVEARSAHDPRPEDERRVAAALSAAIAGFQPLAHDGGVAASAALSPGPLVGFAAAGKSLGLLVVVAAMGGVIATRHSPSEHAAPQTHATTPRIEHAVVATAQPNPVPPLPPKVAFVVSPEDQTPPSAPVAPAARPFRVEAKNRALDASRRAPPQPDIASATEALPASAPTASEELLLIRQADRALRDRRPEAARQILERHAMRFPSGILTQEREGLVVIALCQEGRISEAYALRTRFLVRAPNSPLAARVRAACAEPQ